MYSFVMLKKFESNSFILYCVGLPVRLVRILQSAVNALQGTSSMKMLTALLSVFLAAIFTACSSPSLRPVVTDGTLDAFEKRGGAAEYEFVDGVIVGTAVPDTSNTFLCTKKHYGDFILELEFKVDPTLNSGIQVRSNAFNTPTSVKWTTANDGEEKSVTIAPGTVHGYQIEIDPTDRAWSAGIYDEARRGWLENLKDNQPAREAFRQGEWNKVRVEARGNSLKTWINGVPAADLEDDMTPSGFIGLQVHGVGPRKDRPQVRWRNLRIREL